MNIFCGKGERAGEGEREEGRGERSLRVRRQVGEWKNQWEGEKGGRERGEVAESDWEGEGGDRRGEREEISENDGVGGRGIRTKEKLLNVKENAIAEIWSISPTMQTLVRGLLAVQCHGWLYDKLSCCWILDNLRWSKALKSALSLE